MRGLNKFSNYGLGLLFLYAVHIVLLLQIFWTIRKTDSTVEKINQNSSKSLKVWAKLGKGTTNVDSNRGTNEGQAVMTMLWLLTKT